MNQKKHNYVRGPGGVWAKNRQRRLKKRADGGLARKKRQRRLKKGNLVYLGLGRGRQRTNYLFKLCY